MTDAQLQANRTHLIQLAKQKGLSSAERINSLAPASYFYVPKYQFFGNSMEFNAQLDIRNSGNYKDSAEINITVKGMQINQPNVCCCVFTAMFACLIFPILFVYCDWYRRITEPIYEIKLELYKKLAVLNRNNTLKYLELKITDNYFNQEKANIIYNLLCQSSCTGFTFVNSASNIDMNDGQYSNFDQYMKVFKSIPNLEVNLKWENKIIS